MCGRFVSTANVEALAQLLDASADGPTEALARPSYNVAPTQTVCAGRTDPDAGRVLTAARWGYLPPWAKTVKDRPQPINAKVETLRDGSRMYAGALKGPRRVVVPADGFYEWQRSDDGKLPWFIHDGTGQRLRMAGIASWWAPKGTDDPPLLTVAVVTRTADDQLSWLHDRMPLLLDDTTAHAWLDPDADPGELVHLDGSQPVELGFHRVSTAVNSPRNNRPDLVERLAG